MNSKHAGKINSTSISHGSIEHILTMYYAVALTIISLAPNVGVAQSATPAAAQSPTAADVDAEKESSGVMSAEAPSTGPLVINYPFNKHNGHVNLMVAPDGTYLFSVEEKENMPDKDLDVALALQSLDRGVVCFHYAADAAKGVDGSKQGKSDILRDFFNTFGKHNYTVEYRFTESKQGKAKLYEEQEAKKEKLRKEEKEAKERHDEKLAAEKKAELEKEEKTQREDAQRAAQQSATQSSGGGGSSVWSTVGDVFGAIGTGLLALL
jgi:hypothetical protein